jgi:dihydroorotase
MVGLETALGLSLTNLGPDVETILRLMSWQPAQIAGVADRHGGPLGEGRPANLCVIDPAHEWVVDPATLSSRSHNTPYAGMALRGKVRHTIAAGEAVVIGMEAQR